MKHQRLGCHRAHCLGRVMSVGYAASPCAVTAIPDHLALSWTGNPVDDGNHHLAHGRSCPVRACAVSGRIGIACAEGSGGDAAAVRDGFASDAAYRRPGLTGLTPATKYTYRVGDGTHWSEAHCSRRPSAKPTRVQFLVFGDSQSNPNPGYLEWGKTVEHAAQADLREVHGEHGRPGWTPGQSGAHWNAWFVVAAGRAGKTPGDAGGRQP